MFDYQQYENRIQGMSVFAVETEVQRIRQVLKKQPGNGELYLALGLLYVRLSSPSEALASYKKAQKHIKNPEVAYSKIVELLIVKMGKFSEAIPYYKKWLKLNRNSQPLLTRLARCQLGADKLADALETIRKAERIGPNDPVVHEVYADIHAKLGDVEATRASLEKCLELGASLEVSSRLLTLPGDVPSEELLKKFVGISETLEETEVKYHLLSNIAAGYERRKEYESAFGFFRKGNAIVSANLDKEKELSPFRNLVEAFPATLFNREVREADKRNGPIFVVGMPRSGTTLIESILAGHEEIIDNGELYFLHMQLKRMGLYSVQNALAVPPQPSLKEHIDIADNEIYQKFAENYYAESGFKSKSSRYQVDKLPHNFMSVGFIHFVFPDARIIHCRRHPVDCALSCFKSSFSNFHSYATDLEFLGKYYLHYWELMKHWRKVLPGKMLEVCYEDTVTNTELVARRMIDHIGLEWSDSCLDHTQSKKSVKTASQWQVRQPIYTTSVAKWKNYEKQLQPMIKAMGPCIEEYEAELAALSKG